MTNFIQFSDDDRDFNGWTPVPICHSEREYFVTKDLNIVRDVQQCNLVDSKTGNVLATNVLQITPNQDETEAILSVFFVTPIVDGTMVHLDIDFGDERDHYVSNQLFVIHNNTDGFIKMECLCNEDALGYPFGLLKEESEYLTKYIPARLRRPQPKVDDEVYNTLDGKSIVLYSTIKKEYELETDYLPEEWHDRISAMLCCDTVKIDGVEMHRSVAYEIDWENAMWGSDNKQLMKASAKMEQNFNSRNSN